MSAKMPPDIADRLRRDGRLELNVKVVPKSSRDEIAGLLEDGSLKVKITAAPEKGKANAVLCAFVAEQLGVARSAVRVTAGATSARKRLVVEP